MVKVMFPERSIEYKLEMKVYMEYKKCLVQVDEVLRFLNKEELNKIPLKIRKAIKSSKDKKYVWNYDESKSLSEQDLDIKSIAILSYLNMEYLATKEQKELLKKMHEANEKYKNSKRQ